MKMNNEQLERIALNTSVKIINHDGVIVSGFYIFDNVIATCKHNVTHANGSIATSAEIQVGDTLYPVQRIIPSDTVDLAYITCAHRKMLTYLDYDKFEPKEGLFSYAYCKDSANGEPLHLTFDGYIYSDNTHEFKFSGDSIHNGHSGAPLFCKQTGRIFGYIFERDLDGTGGRGIASQAIIIEANKLDQLFIGGKEYSDLGKSQVFIPPPQVPTEINIKDLSKTESHYNLGHKDKLKVHDVFIVPNHEYIVLEDTEESKLTLSDDTFIDDCIDIIQDNNILFTVGMYGSGKTVVAKSIQHELDSRGKLTYFFNSNFIQELASRHKVVETFDALSTSNSVIFIDGLDEVLSLQDGKRSFYNLINDIIVASSIDGISIVVTIRNLREDILDLALDLAEYNIDAVNSSKLNILKLNYYEKRHYNAWKDKYCFECNNLLEAGEIPPELFDRLLEVRPKSFQNPILLYMLVRSYFKNKPYFPGFYKIYSDFIDQTIHGKFEEERTRTHQSIAGISRQYKDFLRDTALMICKKQEQISDKDKLYAFYQDYDVAEKEEINKQIIKLKESICDIVSDCNIDALETSALSCYFFVVNDSLVRFSDRRIVYFLIAEKIFKTLDQAFTKSIEGGVVSTEKLYDELDKSNAFVLDEGVVRIFAGHYLKENKDKAKQIADSIYGMITGSDLYDASVERFVTENSLSRITADIYLFIIFTNYFDASLRKIGYAYKRFLERLSSISRFWPHTESLRNYIFNDSKISSLSLSRVNLSKFNLSNTHFSNCNFVQSKFLDTNFSSNVFRTTSFDLCSIKTTFRSPSGLLIFSNCKIDSLEIRDPHDLEIHFNSCNINSLTVVGSSKINDKISFVFKKSSTTNFSCNKINIPDITIINSGFQTHKVSHSEIRYHSSNETDAFIRKIKSKSNNITVKP